MSEGFPPQPRRIKEIEAALAAIGAVLSPRSALYVSTPITTGPRALAWHRKNGPTRNGFEHVIAANRADAKRYVARLRRGAEVPLIDPTAFEDRPQWLQPDYHFLWGRVIELYAAKVVFRDGWEYSNGCSYEFLAAVKAGLPLLREDLSPLLVQDGQQLLERAIANIDAPTDSSFLSDVLAQLEVEIGSPAGS